MLNISSAPTVPNLKALPTECENSLLAYCAHNELAVMLISMLSADKPLCVMCQSWNAYNIKVCCAIGKLLSDGWTAPWASYQIRKIAGCACAGNASPRRQFQRKPLVSDPGMHHGTCVTHVPWCMSGSLTCDDGGNVPGIPGACAPAILRIWQEAHTTIRPTEQWVYGKTNKQEVLKYLVCTEWGKLIKTAMYTRKVYFHYCRLWK